MVSNLQPTDRKFARFGAALTGAPNLIFTLRADCGGLLCTRGHAALIAGIAVDDHGGALIDVKTQSSAGVQAGLLVSFLDVVGGGADRG